MDPITVAAILAFGSSVLGNVVLLALPRIRPPTNGQSRNGALTMAQIEAAIAQHSLDCPRIAELRRIIEAEGHATREALINLTNRIDRLMLSPYDG